MKNPPRGKFPLVWMALILAVAGVSAGLVYFAGSKSNSKPPRKSDTAPLGGPGSGTRAMAARLEKIAQESDPMENLFLNHQRAELFRKKRSEAVAPAQQVDAQIRMALEYLFAGETETAIRELSATGPLLEALPQADRPEMSWMLKRFLGLAYMRLGEQDNCVAHHTSHSCLMPLGKEGLHEFPQGSSNAIYYLSQALTQRPQDLESIWLLNIAHMTLGEYPQGVRREWLLAPRLFDSEYDIKRFEDVAPDLGLAAFGRAGGAILEDFDNDGFLDVVCSAWGLREPLRLFHNNGDGTFSERTKAAGLEGLVGGLNMVQADYDNDGYRDILVLRGAWLHGAGAIPNSLLHNNGDGTFSDVTEAAGLLSFHPTQTAGWADYDGDGHLDLFIGNESDERHKHPCELYHNNGNGTFTECAAACGLALIGFVKGVTWGDYDNDGRPDLYLSRFGEPNVLFRNAGPAAASTSTPVGTSWKFDDQTARAGVAQPRDSFPCWFWDYDNDGWLDLLVLPYSSESSIEKVAADYLRIPNPGEKPRLYHNNGNGTFTDVAEALHLARVVVAMGSNFGDLDNDGWLDCYIGTGDPVLSSLMPNRMFRNDAGRRFQDVTTSGGFGHLQKGHAVAFGDIDNDGDQDIYEVIGGAYEGDGFQNVLFENPGHGNHWLTLRLRGVRSNRDAIGSRVAVEVVDGTNIRTLHQVVSSGGSFGASSLQLEMGLGQASAVRKITIRWPLPGQPEQVITNTPMDEVLEIREGEAGFRVLAPKRFKLTSGAK
jgi:hypothetical protein